MITRKVTAGALIAQIAAVSAWAANEFFRVEIPTEIALSMAGIVITVTQYFVPDKKV
jgi:hypothetical protein